MNVLILGAAGYIGAKLTENILSNNHTVYVQTGGYKNEEYYKQKYIKYKTKYLQKKIK